MKAFIFAMLFAVGIPAFVSVIEVAQSRTVSNVNVKPILILKPKSKSKEPSKPKNEIWVMSIDTGIGPHDKLKSHVQYDKSLHYEDVHGHGTHIAGILIYGPKMNENNFEDKLCPNIKIFSCRYYEDINTLNPLGREIDCIKMATKKKMDYINISGGGYEYSKDEYNALKEFNDSGGTFVAAAGNEQKDLGETQFFPASYVYDDPKNRYVPLRGYVAQNLSDSGSLHITTNHYFLAYSYHGKVWSTLPNNSYGWMNGSSQAAPALLHTILKQRCKYLNENSH